MPVPSKIANAPELEIGLEFYYRAFLDLTSSRPVHFGGIGHLPWSVIFNYCTAYGVKSDDIEDSIYIISKMDEAFVKFQYDKSKGNG